MGVAWGFLSFLLCVLIHILHSLELSGCSFHFQKLMNMINCIMTLFFHCDPGGKTFGTLNISPAVFLFSLVTALTLSFQSSNFVFGLVDTVRELLCLMTQSKLSCIHRNTLITSLNCMPSVLTTNGNAIGATVNCIANRLVQPQKALEVGMQNICSVRER